MVSNGFRSRWVICEYIIGGREVGRWPGMDSRLGWTNVGFLKQQKKMMQSFDHKIRKEVGDGWRGSGVVVDNAS